MLVYCGFIAANLHTFMFWTTFLQRVSQAILLTIFNFVTTVANTYACLVLLNSLKITHVEFTEVLKTWPRSIQLKSMSLEWGMCCLQCIENCGRGTLVESTRTEPNFYTKLSYSNIMQAVHGLCELIVR